MTVGELQDALKKISRHIYVEATEDHLHFSAFKQKEGATYRIYLKPKSQIKLEYSE